MSDEKDLPEAIILNLPMTREMRVILNQFVGAWNQGQIAGSVNNTGMLVSLFVQELGPLGCYVTVYSPSEDYLTMHCFISELIIYLLKNSR